jgi:hypothetical protein
MRLVEFAGCLVNPEKVSSITEVRRNPYADEEDRWYFFVSVDHDNGQMTYNADNHADAVKTREDFVKRLLGDVEVSHDCRNCNKGDN